MSRYDRWSHADMPEGAELARIQRGISETMGAIIADRCNPTAMPPSERVTVVGAPQVATASEPEIGRGWQRERPITSPPGQEAIERLVNAALPHGPLEAMRAQIRGLSPEQRAQTLTELETRKGQPFYLEIKALLEEAAEGPAKEAGLDHTNLVALADHRKLLACVVDLRMLRAHKLSNTASGMPRGEDKGGHHAGRRRDHVADVIRVWQYNWFAALFHKRHVVSGGVVGAPLASLSELQNAR